MNLQLYHFFLNPPVRRLARILLLAYICTQGVACDPATSPKPRAYFRIILPARKYQVFDQPGYPYTFEYPTYARIVKDTSFFDEKPENPYWINIEFPDLHGKIYLSYKIIGPKNSFEHLVEDAHKLTYKHTYKAEYIDESKIYTRNGVSGMFFDVGGNAATAKQFFVTDSSRHFLRGALYFDATPNADSLAPVNDFLQKDMWHLINTLQWR